LSNPFIWSGDNEALGAPRVGLGVELAVADALGDPPGISEGSAVSSSCGEALGDCVGDPPGSSGSVFFDDEDFLLPATLGVGVGECFLVVAPPFFFLGLGVGVGVEKTFLIVSPNDVSACASSVSGQSSTAVIINNRDSIVRI
jgi:hypothetical protein